MLSSKISTIAIFLSASFLATASISILPGNDIIVTNTTIPVNDNISLKDYTAPRTWNNKRRDVEIEQPETHSLHERSPDVTVPINDTISLKEYTAPRTWTPKSKNVRIRDSETHRLEKRRISSRCRTCINAVIFSFESIKGNRWITRNYETVALTYVVSNSVRPRLIVTVSQQHVAEAEPAEVPKSMSTRAQWADVADGASCDFCACRYSHW